jgi:hypothetical protein
MTYPQGCNNSNTTAVTCGTGTAYYSTAPAFTPGFSSLQLFYKKFEDVKGVIRSGKSKKGRQYN